MRTVFRSLVAAAILLIAGIGFAAAGDTGPFPGTWNLSVAKSRFGPSPALKSAQRVYTVAGDALDLVITGVAPDGTPFTRHSVFKVDGKDYPITSLGDFDTMSVKRVDAYHFETTMKNAGKAVANMTVTFSPDGKEFTQVARGTSMAGALMSSTSVFEKQ